MDSKYCESIALWQADGKCFEVMADRLSGRIPVTRLERWQDFSKLLESDFFNTNGVQFIFRGHRRYDWSLLPTLGRLSENGIVSAELAEKKGVYTRKKGFDRDTNKALLLKHIRDNKADGSRFQEFLQVLPALTVDEIKTLLKEMKKDKQIHAVGRTRGARWFPGTDSV